MGQDPKSVVLDFVHPAGTRRRLAGRSRQAWFEARNGLFGTHSAPKLTYSGRHRHKDTPRHGVVESSAR
jgi:hypothetical protein